jgi:hypothetical protein
MKVFRMARRGGLAGADHTIPIPIGEGFGPAVTAYAVVVPDKRAPSARRSGIHNHREKFGED